MKFSGVGLVLVLHPTVGLRIAAASMARAAALRVVATGVLETNVIVLLGLARFCPDSWMQGRDGGPS